MRTEILIFPVVKGLVARLASCALGCGLASAVAALAELTLAPLGFIPAALFAGQASSLLFVLFLSGLSLLAPWCHEVLLARRGRVLTRFLMAMGGVMGLLLLAGVVYSLLVGMPLFLRQGELPLMISLVLTVCLLVNMPLMAAAPLRLRVRLACFSLVLLATAVTETPLLVALNDLCRILAVLLGFSPLLTLRQVAPRIVSLPDEA